MSIAVVRTATNRVVTFVRPDLPAGWQPPDGCRAVPDAELPAGWQYEPAPTPAPVEDTLAGVPVTGNGSTLTVNARIVAPADVQVPDPDRGIILKDEDGHDWLLCIAAGSIATIQISSSPEVSQEVRKQRLATARVKVSTLVAANKAKGKGKLTTAERLEAIEAILGIRYE